MMKSAIQPAPADDVQFAVEKFRRAEAEQRRREQIGRGADQEITKAGDDRAERAEEILRRMIRRRGGIKSGNQVGKSFGT